MSIWDRLGDVFDSAKEIGAYAPGTVFNIASMFTKGKAAAKQIGDAFFSTSVGQNVAEGTTKALTWTERNVWSPPTDYFEAKYRNITDAASNPNRNAFERIVDTGKAGLGLTTPTLGFLDPAFREDYWPEARANDSSIAQTVWEFNRASFGNEDAGFFNPVTQQWELPLIDDPALKDERASYFDRGAQKWVTGIGDAAISLTLDPINVVTAGGGVIISNATELTGKSIQAAAATSRGAEKPFVRGAAGTAEVTPSAIRGTLDEAAGTPGLMDDPARAYLRSKLGDDGVQSLFDETAEALNTTGDKTTALSSVLEARGLSAQKVLDEARFLKGDGKLTPANVLSAAGDDLMEREGVEALFEAGSGAEPYFRRGADTQDPVINRLGLNAKKYQSNVEKLTDYAWGVKGAPGTVAKIADDYILGQSSDTGAIADAMSWVAATVADEKTAKGLMDDLQYAAAGDGGALRRVEAFNTKMGLEVEAMASMDRTAALEAIAASPLKTPAEKLAIANDDDLFVRMRTEIEPELSAMLDKFSRFQSSVARVQSAGTLGGVAAGGLRNVGDITKLPLMGTFQPFKSLPPVRIIGGTHLPGRLSLDDPEAVQMYNKWLDQQTNKLGLHTPGAQALTGTLKDDFVAAPEFGIDPGISKGQRANAAWRANEAFKKDLIRRHALRTGGDEEDIALWIDTALDVRKTEMGAIVQGARAAVEAGSPKITRDLNGNPIALSPELSQALGTSQFQDAVDLIDWSKMDEWLTDRYKPGYTDRVYRGTAEVPGPSPVGKTREVTNALLEEVNDAWKVLALTRVAYPIRVQVDTQARNLATMGGLRVLNFLFKGLGNFHHNTKAIDNQVLELLQRKREVFDEMAVILERSGENDERLEALAKIADMDIDDWKKSGMSQVDPGTTRRRSTSFKEFAGGAEEIDPKTGAYKRDRFATYAPGQTPESVLGEGVQESIEGLYKSAEAFYQKKLRKKLGYNYVEYGTSAATRTAWANGYLEAVNHGLRNDASWGRMLAGASDDEIIAWMKSPGEGRAYFKEMNRSKHFPGGPEELVGRQRAHFDNLIPDADKADVAAARNLTLDDLGEWWAGDDVTRPFVPTQIFETLKNGDRTSLYDIYDVSRAKYFKWVAQIPETYMGRHPQYHRFYQEHIDRYVNAAGRERGDDSWTLAEINELRKRADAGARKDMAQIMFDTSHKSNAGHHMRFISPFFSAWEDTMFKWSKIAKENPTASYNTLIKPFESLTSTNNVYDQDGNRIMPNGEKREVLEDGTLGEVVGHSTSINEGYFMFSLPEWMPVMGGQDYRLSRGSLNAIFQGEDWWSPGVGPVVQIPANEVVKNAFPEFDETWAGERILPFGATSESVPEQLAPAHWKNALNYAIRGESSESWQDTFNVAMQDEIVKQRQSGNVLSEKETMAKVTRATRNLLLLKWLGSAVMPASTRPESRLEWYRKEYQRYQSEDPKTALRRFTEDYPEFTEVTISLRDNETGVSASIEANEAADKWKSEIAINPEVGWAFAGPDNYAGEFSRGVYTNQVAKGWRIREDSNATFDRINISKGWQDWQTLTNIVDVELERRGLTSILSNGAEDLLTLKAQGKAQIMRDNPSWADEYNAGGGGADKAVTFLNKMNGAMVRNPGKTAGRQDLQVLQQYITERENLRSVMAEYGVASLPSEDELTEFLSGARDGDPARYALAQGWYEFTGSLKNDSPVFGDMYSRAGLERDTLTNPVVEG